MCNDKRNTSCFAEVLEKILQLQQRDNENEACFSDCSKPFLGSRNTTCLNTRPITLYSCCADKKWEFPATLNGRVIKCAVFRIENIHDKCATFRCLVHCKNEEQIDKEDEFVATDDFFLIDLDCVVAMKCLNDTYVVGL